MKITAVGQKKIMILTATQVRKIIDGEKRGQKNSLQKAIDQQNRIRLHSEVSTSINRSDRGVNEFLQFVRSLLPEDKYFMFLSLFRYPVQTVTLTNRIYTTLSKVFDGRDPYYSASFLSEKDSADWDDYRNNDLKSLMCWKTKGFETMKTAINSIVIVDLPSEQTSERPEPYFEFIDVSNVVGFEAKNNEFDWLYFEHSDGKRALFDSVYYRIIDKKTGLVESEIEHNIGYCPARFFWTTSVNNRDENVKLSPISTSLSKLDHLLFYEVSNEHLNLYGRYPIYSAFASDCDFEEEGGNYCDNGFLKEQTGLYLLESGKPKACPVCAKSRLDGAGSFIEIDPPSEMNGKADLRNPVQIIAPEIGTLEYNNTDLERRRTEIFCSVTGYEGSAVNDQAVNEKQVRAVFESLEAALKPVQWNFEQVMKWVDNTICKIRYGDSFQNVSISLGTEHYLLSGSELLSMYSAAKESDTASSILDMIQDKYFETEFRNNPEQLNRQKILANLDPFRHQSNAEIKTLFDAGLITSDDYLLKVNLSTFIMRFERENININQFGLNLPFDQKIDRIREVLIVYTKEMQPEQIQIAE